MIKKLKWACTTIFSSSSKFRTRNAKLSYWGTKNVALYAFSSGKRFSKYHVCSAAGFWTDLHLLQFLQHICIVNGWGESDTTINHSQPSRRRIPSGNRQRCWHPWMSAPLPSCQHTCPHFKSFLSTYLSSLHIESYQANINSNDQTNGVEIFVFCFSLPIAESRCWKTHLKQMKSVKESHF